MPDNLAKAFVMRIWAFEANLDQLYRLSSSFRYGKDEDNQGLEHQAVNEEIGAGRGACEKDWSFECIQKILAIRLLCKLIPISYKLPGRQTKAKM